MAKVEITYKQVGRNLNVNIDGEVITKVGSKEDLAPIKEALAIYKEKPLAKNLKAIKDLLKPVTVKKEKEIETAKAELKKAKRVAKNTKKVKVEKDDDIISQLEYKIKSGEASEDELNKLRALLDEGTKAKQAIPTPSVGTRKRGEW